MNNIQDQIDSMDRELVQALEGRLELEMRRRRLRQLGSEEETAESGPNGPNAEGGLPLHHRLLSKRFADVVLNQLGREADALTNENRQLVAFQGARGQ